MDNAQIEFAKLSGSGNDFICINNQHGQFDFLLTAPARVGQFAKVLCHRGMGIGADGVIFACQPEIEGVADIAARHFEPDGSEAELCGNGTACFAHWSQANHWTSNHEVKILASAGVVRGRNLPDGYTRVCLPFPEDIQMDLELSVKGRPWTYDFVITGVPHAVTYVDGLDRLDIAHWGPGFRYHEKFQPRGVNANFVQVLGEGELALRTWEFGVEGETLACGTGSASAAILAARRFKWPRKFTNGEEPTVIHARSGDTLRVYVTATDAGQITDLCLDTRVRFLYTGLIHPDLLAAALKE